MNGEVSCSNCVGACCTNSVLVLSVREALLLSFAKTELKPLLPPFTNTEPTEEELAQGAITSWGDPRSIAELEARLQTTETPRLRELWKGIITQARRMQPGDGLFALVGRCGLLDENDRCSAYEVRPRVCQSFAVGSENCLDFRQREGLHTPVDITLRDD